jgi:mannose-6-phosphate isomerase-like protein (cupin superfamily)
MRDMTHPWAVPSMSGQVLNAETSDLVLAEWTDDGGGHEPPRLVAPRHVHHQDDEAFYVLEGSLSFELDGKELTIEQGGAVMIPRGTVHTWWNPSPEPSRYLIVMPRRIHELVAQLHAPGETRTPGEIFRAYESEIVDG